MPALAVRRSALLPGGAQPWALSGAVALRVPRGKDFFGGEGGGGGDGNKHNDRKEDFSLEAMKIISLAWASTQTSGLREGMGKKKSFTLAHPFFPSSSALFLGCGESQYVSLAALELFR